MNPWEEMDKLVKVAQEPIGPEWFTRKQFMARYNMGKTAAHDRIQKMVDGGLLEEWTGVINNKAIGKKWKLK